MTAQRRGLEDRLREQRAETWKPEPGGLVIGTLDEVRWLVSSYDGRDYPLLVIHAEPDGRAVGVHVLHQVLRDELRAQKPRIGERIGIRYLGRVDNRYEGYKLAVDRAEPAEVAWDGPADQGDAPGQETP
jgi:hypothetical protein